MFASLVVGTLAWEQRPEKYDDGEYGWVPGKFPRGMDGNNEGAAGLLQKVMESNITISPLIDVSIVRPPEPVSFYYIRIPHNPNIYSLVTSSIMSYST